ncbi:TIGR03067 domain-containing protein [Limnoglobus roseus]|uniref:TIGR03067 domain-containing protein n=1 Tax=Limnoglobus roseus TaxID=2598579 RepID=A0A5C1A7K7_9BACT|nr:TIGR03067 domain-containing protein [Limnoglobus roseus]QEL15279.1 TIGR03067 domain-containing protein [Limnoglobus roseus]
MARVLFALLTVVLVSGFARADDKTEMKALAGKWTVADAEVDGKKVSETFKNLELVLEGGNYTVKVGGMEDKGTVTVNTAKAPKAMDVSGTEGPNRGQTYPCIYELKDDTLTICYGLDFKTRPTELKTADKSNTMLIVYKRKK